MGAPQALSICSFKLTEAASARHGNEPPLYEEDGGEKEGIQLCISVLSSLITVSFFLFTN